MASKDAFSLKRTDPSFVGLQHPGVAGSLGKLPESGEGCPELPFPPLYFQQRRLTGQGAGTGPGSQPLEGRAGTAHPLAPVARFSEQQVDSGPTSGYPGPQPGRGRKPNTDSSYPQENLLVRTAHSPDSFPTQRPALGAWHQSQRRSSRKDTQLQTSGEGPVGYTFRKTPQTWL